MIKHNNVHENVWAVVDKIGQITMILLVVVIAVMTDRCCGVAEVQVEDSYFYGSSICDVDERISQGCTTRFANPIGRIRCAMKCVRDNACVGASVDADGFCYRHNECNAVTGCVTVATDHVFMSKTCAHGGEWEPSNMRCQCTNGWVGPTCQTYPTKCYDLHHAQNTLSFVRTTLDIFGDGTYLIDAICKRHPSWYQTIAILNEGEHDFNKTWAEYRDGFFIDDNHFWIGLKNLHVLSSNGMFQQMTLAIFFHAGTHTFRRHSGVVVSDESSGYSLTYENPSKLTLQSDNGDLLGNCWSGLQGKPFSTWDEDRDESGMSNCATNAGSGWWYTDCNPLCNLFGWAHHYSSSKPAKSLINLANIVMSDQGTNIQRIQLGIHN